MIGWLADLRHGVKILRSAPVLAFGVIAAFAVGIGANTSIYGVVDAVLLRALPYVDPDRLQAVAIDRDAIAGDRSALSVADALVLGEESGVFASQAVYFTSSQGMALAGEGGSEQVGGTWATADLFETLGVRAAFGRTFQAADGAAAATPVVVLSDALWQRRFGGDRSILGRDVRVDGRQHQVIGVMPPGFAFPRARGSDLYAILKLEPRRVRAPFYLRVVARPKPGAGAPEIAADLARVTARIKERYPDSPRDWSLASDPLKESLVGATRPALLVLLGAVSLVLLIASANIAGLLLARAAGRRREMAVRAALGAGRAALARLALAEALVLAVLGGSAGVLLSLWGTDLLLAWAPRNLPRLQEVHLDLRVLAYTLGVTLACGLLAGLAPALQGRGSDGMAALRDSGRTTADRAGVRLRRLLVVGEFALAVTLLGGAGLLLNSFLRLSRVDPGFDTGSLLSMRLSLPPARYPDGAARTAFFRDLIDRSERIPGVASASVSMALPPDLLQMTNPYTVEGRPIPPGETPPIAAQVLVSPDYFKTLGVPLRRGRAFGDADRADAPLVMLINEAMARRVFPGEEPVGRRLALGDPTPDPDWVTIVGVVGDVLYSGLDTLPEPTLYTPYAQDSWWPSMYLLLRADADPDATAAAVRAAVAAIDPELPVAAVSTMKGLLRASVSEPRFRTTLVGLFAAAAVLLAAIGAYALLSYAVRQRTRELGIRLALGAQRGDVLRLVLADGMRLAIAGTILGLGGALALGRALSGLLYGVGPADPATHALVSATIVAVALVACLVPARRATRVAPTVALRAE